MKRLVLDTGKSSTRYVEDPVVEKKGRILYILGYDKHGKTVNVMLNDELQEEIATCLSSE